MRILPFADALPSGCSRRTLYRRGWKRKELLWKADAVWRLGVDQKLRVRLHDWFQLHLAMRTRRVGSALRRMLSLALAFGSSWRVVHRIPEHEMRTSFHCDGQRLTTKTHKRQDFRPASYFSKNRSLLYSRSFRRKPSNPNSAKPSSVTVRPPSGTRAVPVISTRNAVGPA